MAAKTESPLDEIYRLVQQDMHNYSHVVKEFPLTTMSRAVANAIWHLDLASGGPVEAAGKALDVGTGSGIHAFVAARKGFSQVTAIDVNEKAVELAYARAGRFGFSAHLGAPPADATPPWIAFVVTDLAEATTLCGRKYALISFNPPAYYSIDPVSSASPVARGVYVDDCDTYAIPERGHLYRFFNHIVLPGLMEGGHVICSWPGLERRVVEEEPKAAQIGSPVLPTTLLKKWFQFKFVDDYHDVDQFYNRTATIRDYGLGLPFLRNLNTSIERGYYSRLLCPVDRRQDGDQTFRFGILHLVCEERLDRRFRIVTDRAR